ncbi:T9SS type A sorting domain-containing protein [Candidatus Latescibacterota bacterium]
MKSRIMLLTSTVFLFFQCVCTASDYFPLEVGNVWFFVDKYSGFAQDTKTVDQMTVIEGKEYFHMFIHYYRKDNTGKVYIVPADSLDTVAQSEAVIYDFGANVGDSWNLNFCDIEYVVTLESISDTVETFVGTFFNCYHFSFMAADDHIADADFSCWFAPDIGQVQATGSFAHHVLADAIVNGIHIESSVSEEKKIPLQYVIINFPNPFNISTTISFSLPQNAHTFLEVYSATGNKISTLVDKPMNAGKYSINFNGDNLPSGAYFYRLKSGNYNKTGRMLLVK